MASTFSNPLYAPEPYEEYGKHQERDPLLDTPTPTDAGRPNSAAMDNQDVHRKASRAKSRHSLFSRKSKKETDATESAPVMLEQQPSRETGTSSPSGGEGDSHGGEGLLSRGMIGNHFAGLSILPEVIPELPAWYNDGLEWIAASAIQFRVRYPVHNPAGPKWYKNQHLIPPSERDNAMRPPSIFSPSFPPMTAPETSEDWDPSRTPSGSPLPTPDSSQVRINEVGIRVRTRKTSQGAHDPVDLLDVSDPWGSHWHHESPYDIGMTPSPVSVDMPEGPPKSRSRMSSMSNTPTRHRSVIPSPLSQSTSAIHLHPPEPDVTSSIPRRLSRRRRPGIRNFFAGSSHNDDHELLAVASAPATPVDYPVSSNLAPPSNVRVGRKLSKRGMTSPVISPSPTPSISTQDTQKKRGSIFGALTKRFTMVRRHPNRTSSDDAHDKELSADTGASTTPDNPSSHERRSSGLTKRVPPPSADDIPHPTEVPHPSQPLALPEPAAKRDDHGHSDRESVLEAPFSMGRLTITNPDADVGSPNSPARTEVPLPPEKDVPAQPRSEQLSSPVGQILEQDELVDEPEQLQEPHSIHNLAHDSSSRAPGASTANGDQMQPSLGVPNVPKEPSPAVHHPAPAVASVDVAKSLAASRPADAAPALSQSPPRVTEASSVQSVNRVPEPQYEEPYQQPASAVGLESERPRGPDQDEPLLPPPSLSAISSVATDDSPLSRASIIANPGTPHMHSVTTLPEINTTPSVPATDTVVPVTSSSAPIAPGDTVQSTAKRDGSPTKGKEKSKSRQTETFRLVRSPSGTVRHASGAITADGEMWEIVEAKDTPHRSRTKDRTKSSEQDHVDSKTSSHHERTASQREDHRHHKGDSGERHKSSSGRHSSTSPVVAGPSSSQSRARSVEKPRRPAIPEQLLDQREQRPHTQPKERHFSPDKRAVNGKYTSSALDVTRSQKRVSGNNDVAGVHRRSSRSGPRPTSDAASVDDFENFRAREAWEMDRLYKGRSWDVEGPRSALIEDPHIAWHENGKQAQVGRSHTVHSADYGSSHTSVVVQRSFHAHASSPAIYSVPTTSSMYPQSSSRRSPSYDHPNGYRPRQDSVPFPTHGSSSSPNPLPEPPREANYQPTPLPAGLPDSPSSPEYWNKYAGLTAAH
ncbi:hypothetical protein NEOLEDRAFT_1237943 [Neolentinus lepideus HHB14362 ss-1]|uniref:Uncharacterized protein n=1 Tax=Neolentinus lepideus HHB14362 ss-1 TaxID=1314782 RepID=A0A165W6F0_9AGAM|nr:hypothetical protein NEOLEDRAFT_1237943 [Neolentinus lepideus HHB14362 ss-1]